MGKRTISNHFGVTGAWLYVWLMVVNSTSMLLFGYDQGVFGGIITLPNFEQKFGLQGNEVLKGVVVGSYDLGCLIGALATGPIGGWIGRKRSVLLGTTIMMIGAFLQLLASDFGIMTAGRVIAGIGNGMNTATAPVWASETSSTANRGKTGMTLMVVNIGGLAISCWMTYALSFVDTELAWRFPLGFQLFFVLIIYLTAFWLPESPRWLIMKHKNEKALEVMVALEGPRGRDDALVTQDFDEIKESMALEQSKEGKRNTRPGFRLVLGVGVQAMQQLTGINIICYYLPYVLANSVGLTGSTARLLGAVNAMTYLGSTFIGLYFIDHWGRRRLMIYGALGQCCSWLAITIVLNSADDVASYSSKQRQLAGVAVFFFFLFNCFFGAGWLGVSWLYPTEIHSTKYRISGMSYGVATNWLINFAVVFVTPLGIARLGPQFYIIWTVLNALMVPIIWLFYPETAGRSLENIATIFEAHPTVWVFRHKSMVSQKPMASGGDTAEDVWIGLDEVPTWTTVEYAQVAKKPEGGLSEISVSPTSPRVSLPPGTPTTSAASSMRYRGSEQHPEVLVQGSQTMENTEQVVEADLAHTATLTTTQTAPSLGPQDSTVPFIVDPACRGFECVHP